MDGELTPGGAADVKKHLQGCGECRGRIARYEGVSRDFTAYYVVKSQAQPVAASVRRFPQWAPYAAAILLIVCALILRTGKRVSDVHETAKGVSPASIETPVEAIPVLQPAPRVIAHHRVPRSESPIAQFSPNQAAIQIAIPAEAMFPPGAVPEGAAYIASLAPDGSIQSIRLQP
jgi:hypothetical protein